MEVTVLKLKRCASYEMNLDGKGATGSAVLAGLCFFLLAVYYFGFRNLSDCGTGEVIFHLALPLVLMTAHMVCLRGIRLNLPLIYGAFGAVWCLLLIIINFSCQNGFRIPLSLIWYILTGAVLILTVCGFVPTRIACVAAFLIPLVFRLLACDIIRYFSQGKLVGFLPEAAILCGLGAFACLGGALRNQPQSK